MSGNSNVKILKKKKKKQSIELIQKIVDLFENDILDDFDKPDVKKVLRICKAIKVGNFTNIVHRDFGDFKFPLNGLINIVNKIEEINAGSKQLHYKTQKDYALIYIERLYECSEKIFENYQAANRDATIDALLEE